MESVMVKYDGTVRNQVEQVIQLLYGEDGLDATQLEWMSLPSQRLSNSSLEKKYRFDLTTISERQLRRWLTEDVVKDIMANSSILADMEKEYQKIYQDRGNLRHTFNTGNDRVVLPVNLERLITNAKKIFSIDKRRPTSLHPLRIFEVRLSCASFVPIYSI